MVYLQELFDDFILRPEHPHGGELPIVLKPKTSSEPVQNMFVIKASKFVKNLNIKYKGILCSYLPKEILFIICNIHKCIAKCAMCK